MTHTHHRFYAQNPAQNSARDIFSLHADLTRISLHADLTSRGSHADLTSRGSHFTRISRGSHFTRISLHADIFARTFLRGHFCADIFTRTFLRGVTRYVYSLKGQQKKPKSLVQKKLRAEMRGVNYTLPPRASKNAAQKCVG
jgi:hypothetical protein